jgi:hypothetical protein
VIVDAFSVISDNSIGSVEMLVTQVPRGQAPYSTTHMAKSTSDWTFMAPKTIVGDGSFRTGGQYQYEVESLAFDE